MTIMILHPNPIEAAQFLCDKDLKRTLIELREFLLNALLGSGANGKDLPSYYDERSVSFHTLHPFTIWLKKSHGNFSWLHDYAIAVAIEYVEAHGKEIDEGYTINDYHNELAKMWHENMREKHIPFGKRTPFIACIPTEFHVHKYGMSDMLVVESYRAYYKALCLMSIDIPLMSVKDKPIELRALWDKRVHDYHNDGIPSWFMSAPIVGVPSDEFIEKALNDLNERIPDANYDSLQSGADPSANDCPHTDFTMLTEDITVYFKDGAQAIKIFTTCNTCGAYGVLRGTIRSSEGINWDNKLKANARRKGKGWEIYGSSHYNPNK